MQQPSRGREEVGHNKETIEATKKQPKDIPFQIRESCEFKQGKQERRDKWMGRNEGKT